MEWNYVSKIPQSSGYEDVLDTLKKYNKQIYINSSTEEQERIIEEIFTIYRSKNIFPITYYNEEGVKNEIQKCIDKDVMLDGDVLNLSYNQGSSLCKFLFPNLFDVHCLGGERNSMTQRFFNDHKLKKTIKMCLKHKNGNSPTTPANTRAGMELVEHGHPTNFKPMNAKALYEKYTPKNGVIFDYACGFGGRMLGALTSKNNYTYLGVEPNTETFKNLNTLGEHIEKVTGRKNSFKIICKGSEDINNSRQEYVDFAFSSPPYFSLEQYCQEESQCYIKFPTIDEWINGYVYPTIKNIYEMLKPNSYYAVNIADFKVGKAEVEFVNKWIELSIDVGFTYVEQIFMKLQNRRGDGHAENIRGKQEGIFVFKKEKLN